MGVWTPERGIMGIWMTEQRCSFVRLTCPSKQWWERDWSAGGGWSRVQTKAGMKGCSAHSLEGTVSQQELSAATCLSTDPCHVGKCGSKISFLPGTEIFGDLGQQCLLVQPETASAPAKAGAAMGPWARRERTSQILRQTVCVAPIYTALGSLQRFMIS